VAIALSCSTKESSQLVNQSQAKILNRGCDSTLVSTGKVNIKIPLYGKAKILPNQIHAVQFPIPVEISNIFVQNGQFVKTGTRLFSIKHPNILDIQRKHLHYRIEYNKQRKNFTRQGELALEKASSLKQYERIEADYLSAEANYLTSCKLLKALHINPDKVSADNLNSEIIIHAQQNGKIKLLENVLNNYVEEGKSILEISNTETSYIEATVSHVYFPFLKQGDTLTILPWKEGIDTTFAEVKFFENEIDEATNAFSVFSNSLSLNEAPVNQPVKLIISLNTNTISYIPKIYLDNYKHNAVFIRSADTIKRQEVMTGIEWNSSIQLIGFPDNQKRNFILKPTCVQNKLSAYK
jgi:multidrug efflux pump subunit AcrA (membrane-fusion protein)